MNEDKLKIVSRWNCQKWQLLLISPSFPVKMSPLQLILAHGNAPQYHNIWECSGRPYPCTHTSQYPPTMIFPCASYCSLQTKCFSMVGREQGYGLGAGPACLLLYIMQPVTLHETFHDFITSEDAFARLESLLSHCVLFCALLQHLIM